MSGFARADDGVRAFAKGRWKGALGRVSFGKHLESLQTVSKPLSSGRGGELRRRQIAFDTGEGGGGFLGSIAVMQSLPRALHFLQNFVRGGFPVNGLGVFIPPVEELSDILLQGLDRGRGSVLEAFPVGCGSFAFEAKALSVNRIAGVRSVHGARMRGDIDTPAGYLAGARRC